MAVTEYIRYIDSQSRDGMDDKTSVYSILFIYNPISEKIPLKLFLVGSVRGSRRQ